MQYQLGYWDKLTVITNNPQISVASYSKSLFLTHANFYENIPCWVSIPWRVAIFKGWLKHPVYLNLAQSPSSCSLVKVAKKGKENMGEAQRILNHLSLKVMDIISIHSSLARTCHMDTIKFKGSGEWSSQLGSCNTALTLHCGRRCHALWQSGSAFCHS